MTGVDLRLFRGDGSDQRSTLGELALMDAAAGGLATFAADSVMHPVDTVKARLQAQREARYRGMFDCFRKVVETEGARKGLYAGLGAVLMGGVPCAMLVFSSYQTSKRLADEYLINAPSAAIDFVSGAIGEISGMVTYVPSEVVAKRMQISGLGPGRNYESTFQALRVIFRSEGLRGLYSGSVPTMLRDVPCTALQFMFFERLKSLYEKCFPTRPVNGAELGVIGFVAGGGAAFLTNPFDVVKTRLQTQPSGSERLYAGTVDCIRQTVKNEGLLALCRGAGARVMWVAPASAITLAVYTKAAEFLQGLRATHLETDNAVPAASPYEMDRRR